MADDKTQTMATDAGTNDVTNNEKKTETNEAQPEELKKVSSAIAGTCIR
jgi:hypothetical protein